MLTLDVVCPITHQGCADNLSYRAYSIVFILNSSLNKTIFQHIAKSSIFLIHTYFISFNKHLPPLIYFQLLCTLFSFLFNENSVHNNFSRYV